jgi:hypothetical protein
MKIISNFKDYYDFLQMNGIDEKVVYDRRTQVKSWNGEFVKQGYNGPQFIKEKEIVNFHICGNLIRLKFEDNKYQFDMQIPTTGKFISQKQPDPKRRFDNQNLNIRYNCPIILSYSYDTVLNPKLSLFDFGKYLAPEAIYQLLYDWCSTTFIPEDNRTDKEKITGNGFDIKHSFRNTK